MKLRPRARTYALRSLARLLAALGCVLLALGADLAGGLHLATVQHVVCPVHGELLHEDASHADLHGDAEPSALPGDTPLLTQAADEAEHEVCTGVVGVREPTVPLVREGSTVRALPPGPAWVPPVGFERARGIARLRLAPKQSPPA